MSCSPFSFSFADGPYIKIRLIEICYVPTKKGGGTTDLLLRLSIYLMAEVTFNLCMRKIEAITELWTWIVYLPLSKNQLFLNKNKQRSISFPSFNLIFFTFTQSGGML